MIELDPIEKLRRYLRAELVHNAIRDEIRKELETMPLILSDHTYQEDEYVNSYTTHEMFTLNNMLAHTKELGVKKKKKYNYITTLFLRGYKIIKNRKDKE